MTEKSQQTRGILVKDEEGNIYFLRPEILELCKVSQEELKAAPSVTTKFPGVQIIGTLTPDTPLNPEVAKHLNAVKPNGNGGFTTMCPW